MSLLINSAAGGLLKISPQEGVTLSPGQIISGRVEAVRDDGTVALNLSGFTVEAAAEVQLHPGQEVALEVIGRFAGRLYLKLAGDSTAAAGSAQLNGRLDRSRPADADRAVLFNILREFQLPLTEKNLASLLRDYLRRPANLGAALPQLLLALEQQSLPPAMLPALPASPPAPDLEFFRLLLAELLGEEWRSFSSRPEIAAPAGAEKAAGLLRDWLAIQKPLACLLRLIQVELGKKEEGAALPAARREELARTVEALLSEVLGQQLINTVDKSRPAHPDYCYFSWPLPSPASQCRAELRIYCRRGGRPLDLEDLYLVFCLQTPHLGSNRFDIRLRQREMEIRITVEKAEAVALVEEFWPELSQRLQALGYRASLRECRAGLPEPLRPRPDGGIAGEEIRHIDILV